MKTYIDIIFSKTGISKSQIERTVNLLDNDNTVPFISRYKKSETGNLSDEQVETIDLLLEPSRDLVKKRDNILSSLKERNLLNKDLERCIAECLSMKELMDIYEPYVQKRETKADIARKKGRDKFVSSIYSGKPISEILKQSKEKDDLLLDISEIISDDIKKDITLKTRLREKYKNSSQIQCKKKSGADTSGKYSDYYGFEVNITKIKPHQILALLRAENEKALSINMEIDDSFKDLSVNGLQMMRNQISENKTLISEIAKNTLTKTILPSVKNGVKEGLFEIAENHAIDIFSKNLKNILLQKPLKNEIILGLDPGFSSGCKVAVIDKTGKLLATDVIYPHEPQSKQADAALLISSLIKKYKITVISIGNGTASRESEVFISKTISSIPNVFYTITSEAGASVYSASKLAREEFPKLDVSLRGAISIARRIQDPLAELIKIDPKSIGVGMYQHDLDEKKLDKALEMVIISVVNSVGVDINTASTRLLSYVSGLNNNLAKNIVDYRESHGKFKSRSEIKKVSGIGDRAFEQCSGFLNIYDGTNELDETFIHPSQYKIVKEIFKLSEIKSIKDADKSKKDKINKLLSEIKKTELADLLKTSVSELDTIVNEIVSPSHDLREKYSLPLLKREPTSLKDLVKGQNYQGTVRNVTDFGIFVDIGMKKDGMIYKNKGSDSLKVGDVIDVRVETIDIDRERVSLSVVNS